MDIRLATAADAAAISALISGLAHFFTVDPGGAGAEAFLDGMTPAAVAQRIASPEFRCFVACDGNGLSGVAVVQNNAHLLHLFVAQRAQGRGLGRRLWEHARRDALQAGNPGRFSVNSSVFAVPVYEAFGFRADGPHTERNGIAFVPMVFGPADG